MQFSIEDTASIRGRLKGGKRGPSAFDPYAGAVPARPPTAKKDLRPSVILQPALIDPDRFVWDAEAARTI
jgi:hypothetical protein